MCCQTSTTFSVNRDSMPESFSFPNPNIAPARSHSQSSLSVCHDQIALQSSRFQKATALYIYLICLRRARVFALLYLSPPRDSLRPDQGMHSIVD